MPHDFVGSGRRASGGVEKGGNRDPRSARRTSRKAAAAAVEEGSRRACTCACNSPSRERACEDLARPAKAF